MEESGQSISGMVDQSLVSQLMEMGFSKAVSEKALFLTQSKDLENPSTKLTPTSKKSFK
jgi:uncharacterized UBP type Zn finger protein